MSRVEREVSNGADPSQLCYHPRRAAELVIALRATGRGTHVQQVKKKCLVMALFALVRSHPVLTCEIASLDSVSVTNHSRKTFPAVLTAALTSAHMGSEGANFFVQLCHQHSACGTQIGLNIP